MIESDKVPSGWETIVIDIPAATAGEGMSEQSAIEWTNSTWNPVTGCSKLSAGCDHCYAERFSERFRGVKGHPFEAGFDLTLRPERIEQPERWRRPRMIFVNSMSDLFHKNVPADYIDRVFDAMESSDWHIYQILTKRSSLMRTFVNRRYVNKAAPSHIWLGVSIENATTLSRLKHLKQTNASTRFISFEPLLGRIGEVDYSGIQWVICGGESGPGARPANIDWLREIRDQCLAQRVPFFFKQWGGRTPKAGGNALDGRQWLEYPGLQDKNRTEMLLQVAGSPVKDETSSEPMEVGPWAREKLQCLQKYLREYTKIMRKQRFKKYFYIDAFAGSGSLKVRQAQTDDQTRQLLLSVSEHAAGDTDGGNYISGSPRAALEIEHQFTDYIFIELDDERVQHLHSLKREFEMQSRIYIRKKDCNDYLRELLRENVNNWKHQRGIVFLDPFGMHVPWDTIAALGKTRAIEVFINFPVGMAIQRLLKRRGDFSERERSKLDSYFGTDEWFDLLYRQRETLFGTEEIKIDRAADTLVKWYRNRLKNEFGYVSLAREIQNTKGRPLYYLIFAGPNQTGMKIANYVLSQGARAVR